MSTVLFKRIAFSILYLYMGIMVCAFIFCLSRKSHSVGLTMHTAQLTRIEANAKK